LTVAKEDLVPLSERTKGEQKRITSSGGRAPYPWKRPTYGNPQSLPGPVRTHGASAPCENLASHPRADNLPFASPCGPWA